MPDQNNNKTNNIDTSNNKYGKIIQTYAEDMASVLADSKGGLVKKMIAGASEAEQEKKRKKPNFFSVDTFFAFASLLVFCLTFLVIYFYLPDTKLPTTVEVAPQFTPIIFTEKNIFLEVAGLEKDAIQKNIISEVEKFDLKNKAVGGVFLNINNKFIGLRNFILLNQLNFLPGDPVFVDDNFLYGVVKNTNTTSNTTSKTTPSLDSFMLLKVSTLSDVFLQLRAWEKTMFQDLKFLFNLEDFVFASNVSTLEFKDGIVENKNARILYDDNKNIALMYVFLNERFVIIANTKEAVNEIMLRVSSSQILK